jgi:hypothetical protein
MARQPEQKVPLDPVSHGSAPPVKVYQKTPD